VEFFNPGNSTIDEIETVHMIRNGQLSGLSMSTYKQFMVLAG